MPKKFKRPYYQKQNALPPESYEAQQRQAWQEHNNTFSPVWIKLRQLIRNTAIDYARKRKPIPKAFIKLLSKEIADYIDLSRASFYHYIVTLNKYYVADQLSKAEYKGEEMTLALKLMISVMDDLSKRRLVKPKPTKKKKTKRKKKK